MNETSGPLFIELTRRHPAGVVCRLVAPPAMKYFSCMTTMIRVSRKRQGALPKELCKRKKIKHGTALPLTEMGEGLYVAPVPEPTEKELKEIIAAACSLTRQQSRDDEEMARSHRISR